MQSAWNEKKSATLKKEARTKSKTMMRHSETLQAKKLLEFSTTAIFKEFEEQSVAAELFSTTIIWIKISPTFHRDIHIIFVQFSPKYT